MDSNLTQAPLSMRFSRQGYWSGLPWPPWMKQWVMYKVQGSRLLRFFIVFKGWNWSSVSCRPSLPATTSLPSTTPVTFPPLSLCWYIPWDKGFPGSSTGKESACKAGDSSSIPGSGRSPGERIGYPLQYSWASLVAQTIKNPPAMLEIWVQVLGWEDPLEEGMATHSGTIAWRIPHGQRNLAGYSPWGCKELDTAEWQSTAQHHRTRNRSYLLGKEGKDA